MIQGHASGPAVWVVGCAGLCMCVMYVCMGDGTAIPVSLCPALLYHCRTESSHN